MLTFEDFKKLNFTKDFVDGDEVYFDPAPKHYHYLKYGREFYNYYRGFIKDSVLGQLIQVVYKNNEKGPLVFLSDIKDKYIICLASEFLKFNYEDVVIEQEEKGKAWGVPYLDEEGKIPSKFIRGGGEGGASTSEELEIVNKTTESVEGEASYQNEVNAEHTKILKNAALKHPPTITFTANPRIIKAETNVEIKVSVAKGILDVKKVVLQKEGTTLQNWSSEGTWTVSDTISDTTHYKVIVTDAVSRITEKEFVINKVLTSYIGPEDNLEEILIDDSTQEFTVNLNDEKLVYKYPKSLGKLKGVNLLTSNKQAYNEIFNGFVLDETDANYYVYTLGVKCRCSNITILFIGE